MPTTEDDQSDVAPDDVTLVSPDLPSVISRDFLTCRICLEPFTRPRLLPCLHTFCHGCLQQCILAAGPDDDSIACPTCRGRAQIPVDGAAGFKANFFVSSLQEAMTSSVQQRLCENCSERHIAAARCLDCRDFLCDACRDAHKRTKLTKQHQVLTMEELQRSDHSTHTRQQVMCSSHNEPITLVCIPCNHPICMTCKVTAHDSHKASDLKDTARNDREIISSILRKARDGISTVSTRLQNLDQYETTMDANNTSVLGAIQRRRVVLRDLIKDHTRKLAEELHEITRKTHRDIRRSRDQLNNQMASLRDVVQFAAQLLEHGSDDDFVFMKSELQSRVESLQDVHPHDSPTQQQTQLTMCTESDIHVARLCGELHLPDTDTTPEVTRGRRVNAFDARTETDEKVCYVSSIAIGAKDNVLLLDQNNRKIKIFSRYGVLAGEFRLSPQMKSPMAIAVLRDRKIAVLDERTGIEVFTHTGRHIGQARCPARAPLGMAAHKPGQVLVTDRQTKSIFVVDVENNATLQTVTMPGVFQKPAAVASSNNGHIVVADLKGHCVHVIDTDGHLAAEYGTKGNGENEMSTPTSVCTDGHSNVIVCDYHNCRVHVLSHDAKFLTYIADASDGLLRPTAVAVSSRGHAIIAEDSGKVVVYRYFK